MIREDDLAPVDKQRCEDYLYPEGKVGRTFWKEEMMKILSFNFGYVLVLFEDHHMFLIGQRTEKEEVVELSIMDEKARDQKERIGQRTNTTRTIRVKPRFAGYFAHPITDAGIDPEMITITQKCLVSTGKLAGKHWTMVHEIPDELQFRQSPFNNVEEQVKKTKSKNQRKQSPTVKPGRKEVEKKMGTKKTFISIKEVKEICDMMDSAPGMYTEHSCYGRRVAIERKKKLRRMSPHLRQRLLDQTQILKNKEYQEQLRLQELYRQRREEKKLIFQQQNERYEQTQRRVQQEHGLEQQEFFDLRMYRDRQYFEDQENLRRVEEIQRRVQHEQQQHGMDQQEFEWRMYQEQRYLEEQENLRRVHQFEKEEDQLRRHSDHQNPLDLEQLRNQQRYAQRYDRMV